MRAVFQESSLTRANVDMERAIAEAEDRQRVELFNGQFTVDLRMSFNELEDRRDFAARSEFAQSLHDVTLNDFIVNFLP